MAAKFLFRFFFVLCSFAAMCQFSVARSPIDIDWKSQKLSSEFLGEGGTLADLDADGHTDAVAGPVVFFGPDFKTSAKLYESKPYSIAGYSDYFFAFGHDMDSDSDLDIVIIGFPGKAAHWYRNPGKKECRKGMWERFAMLDVVDNESPTFEDITGDNKPELVCCKGGRFGYAEMPTDPTAIWTFHPISAPGPYQRFTHGLGVGDVNDDGRLDLMAKHGWWEHPKTLSDAEWQFHAFEFSGPGGAQMIAVDLDGDGKNEVVTSLAAHGYGLCAYQKKDPASAENWNRIDIMTDKVETSPTGLAISQLHAVAIADIDRDGKPDIVSGKRFWAHNGNDNGENDPPQLVWFKPIVNAKGMRFQANLIDDDSGVGTQILVRDANGDNKPDILSVSKRGVHLLSQSIASKIPTIPADEGTAMQSAPIDDPLGGFRPAWNEKSVMNVDFETGDLRHWKATGAAFFNQPIRGDMVSKRRNDMASEHQGEFWLGTFEVTSDIAFGSLTSKPFQLNHPWISFLLGGGSGPETRFELIDASDGTTLKKISGANTETLRRALFNVEAWKGKAVQIRLIDNAKEGWGHINFDDFRLHAAEPSIPAEQRLAAPDVLSYQSLPANKVAEAMTLPNGFSVQVVASEPDVRQPIAMTIDHRGRVWVAEAYQYPIRAKGDNGNDRVLIFEDTDANGTLDSRKVFCEGLNLVSGIEVGFGGLWVGAAPYLLFIPDKDGDDVPDGPPVKKLDGWGLQDTHETLNSFIWGPDGWLYGCHGVFTHSEVRVVSKPNAAKVKINGGIWRYHPVQDRFEVFAHGTSNPWGVDFDDRGQAFLTACVIPHLYHVIPNARYQRQAGEHFNKYTYDDIPTIAKHRHWIGATPHAGNNRSDSSGGGHAHSGAMIYLGGSWPAPYRDQLFMNNIHGARLNQDQLTRVGSGYSGDRAPDFLLANDKSSQILYFRYGPDGQVIAIDWYDAEQCHVNDPKRHDQSNGRIYRIAYNNAKPIQIDLAAKSDDELVAYQSDANDWYCRTARRLLMERSSARPLSNTSKAQLVRLTESSEARLRLRGLWTAAACNLLDDTTMDRATRDPDETVRAWGARLDVARQRSDSGAVSEATAKRLLALRDDPSPVVRLELASLCQTLPSSFSLPILQSLVKHAEDSTDHNLPLMVWYAVSKCLEQSPESSALLLESCRIDLVSRFLARQWTETYIDGAGGEIASFSQLLVLIAKEKEQNRARWLLDAVLVAMEKKRTVPAPADWKPISKLLMARTDDSFQTRVLLLASKFSDDEAIEELKKSVVDTKNAPEKRQSALSVLKQVKASGLVDIASGLLKDPSMRIGAISALSDSLDAGRSATLVSEARLWPELSDRRAAWYGMLRRPETIEVLLKAIASDQIPASELSADMVQQIRRFDSAALNQQVESLWGNVRELSKDKEKAMEQTKKMIEDPSPGTDLGKGQMLFAKSCGQCHVLFGEGGKIGPELTGSNRKDLKYLLENILDPSAVMAKEYRPLIVQTTDGQTITGILRSSNKDSLRIQTATEEVVLYSDDIAQKKQSEVSMMPSDLLSPLKEDEVRDLMAYIRSR